jgi:hypothetical protein
VSRSSSSGGGFGLYLKREHLVRTREWTLLERLPESRATNDLDLFLTAEGLADLARVQEVAGAIRRLGYVPAEEAKFLQWKREITVAGVSQEVKIDVLVGPLGNFRDRLPIKEPRVRPRGNIEFHAHTVEEALHVEEDPVEVTITLARPGQEPRIGTVLVPQAFPYLMMKLFAFDDRKDDTNRDLGRHHALDLYTIVGMMTEREYERARELGSLYQDNTSVRRAQGIVRDHFTGRSGQGMLRLREHRLFRDDFLMDEFGKVLREVFLGNSEGGPATQ